MVGRGSGWQNSGIEKKIRNPEKNSRINQEMVNTIFLPLFLNVGSTGLVACALIHLCLACADFLFFILSNATESTVCQAERIFFRSPANCINTFFLSIREQERKHE